MSEFKVGDMVIVEPWEGMVDGMTWVKEMRHLALENHRIDDREIVKTACVDDWYVPIRQLRHAEPDCKQCRELMAGLTRVREKITELSGQIDMMIRREK